MMSTKKDFVGRVMAGREALVAPDRQVVIGIKPIDRTRRLRSGAHIIPKGKTPGSGDRPGLCHLGLLLAGARPVDRAGARRARPRTHRRDRCRTRSAARRGLRGRALQPCLLRSGRRAPAWLSFPGSPALRWSTRSSRAARRPPHKPRPLADGGPRLRPGAGHGAARAFGSFGQCGARAFRRCGPLWAEGCRSRKCHARSGRDPTSSLCCRPAMAISSMDALRQAFSGLASLSDQSRRARSRSRRRTGCARHAGQAVVDRPASGGISNRKRCRHVDRPHQRQSVARQRSAGRTGGVQPAGPLRPSRKAFGTPCSTPRPNTASMSGAGRLGSRDPTGLRINAAVVMTGIEDDLAALAANGRTPFPR